jgi:hypothetical protein
MASSINRQAAQALLKILKARESSVGQKLKAAELIRVFQGIGPVEPPTPDTESVPDSLPNTLDL